MAKAKGLPTIATLKSAAPTIRKYAGPETVKGIARQDIQRATLDIDKEHFEERYQKWDKRGNGQPGGSREEFICWEYLVKVKRYVEDVDFGFQVSRFGGRRTPGGKVIDFVLFKKFLIWRPQGEYYHIRLAADRAKDLIERMAYTGLGYKVIDLYARDLNTRPRAVLDAAWEGRELVRSEERFH